MLYKIVKIHNYVNKTLDLYKFLYLCKKIYLKAFDNLHYTTCFRKYKASTKLWENHKKIIFKLIRLL